MKTLETTRISYAELADRLDDYLLCNSIEQADDQLIDNLFNGTVDYCTEHDESERDKCIENENCEFENFDIYQSYLISQNDAEYLQRHTNEIVYYSPLLDLYVWQITHWGTSWSGVFTDFEDREEV